jgi:putative ABC transport system permease protein
MAQRDLWVRWSWRDLRRRWALVAAISLVIALGTGTYAALLSTSAWRTESNDASFSALHMHDLRVSLSRSSTTAEGSLNRLIRSIPATAQLSAVRERLMVSLQAAGPGDLLVPGELVGTDASPGPVVDGVSDAAGRSLTATDDGQLNVVVDRGFAKSNRLPAVGTLTVSGGRTVRYVGQGQSPEYFLVSGSQGALPFLTQKSYAVLFAGLHTAQRLTGQADRVNDAVITVRPGADRAAIQQQLQRALADTDPPLSATVTTRDDVSSYRVLYRDIRNDEQLWRIIALLLLGGAAFATLNLTTRVVEAQRREIGIGMALGVSDRLLALRPLLFGAQIAVIGVALGLGVGWLVGMPLRAMFVNLIPLPVWRTPFQPGVFAQAAAIGFALPLAAVAWPVWRAVHARPVDAIRVGHLAARGGRAVRVLARVRLPGRSYRQAPLRNLLRSPRRSLLTAVGVAVAVTTLVTVTGFLDTFNATLTRSQHELLHLAPDRITATLQTFEPTTGRTVSTVRHLPQVATVTTGLLVPTTVVAGRRSLDTVTEVLDPNAPWTPTVIKGRATGGIILAAKAAADLHVQVGDTIIVKHPQATPGGFRTVETSIPVTAIHPNPLRMLSYLDPASASSFNLTESTNLLIVQPAAAVTANTLGKALLAVPGVASAESARATTEGMRTSLNQYLGILQIAGAITLLLALLISFNTASIGMDERRREHATMLAFGLPGRTVLALNVAESALLGALGTVLGVVGGYAMLVWMTKTTVPSVMPDIGVTATLAPATFLLAFLLGTGVVAAAPLLTFRRLRKLDIPSALRLVE